MLAIVSVTRMNSRRHRSQPMCVSNFRCRLGAPVLARAHPGSGRRTRRRALGETATLALTASPPVARRDAHTTVQSEARLAAVADGIVDVPIRWGGQATGVPALDQEKGEAECRRAA